MSKKIELLVGKQDFLRIEADNYSEITGSKIDV